MCKIIRKADVHKVFNFSCNAKIRPLSFQKILLNKQMVCGFSLTLVSCLLRFFFYLTLFEYSIDPALGFINDYNKNKF